MRDRKKIDEARKGAREVLKRHRIEAALGEAFSRESEEFMLAVRVYGYRPILDFVWKRFGYYNEIKVPRSLKARRAMITKVGNLLSGPKVPEPLKGMTKDIRFVAVAELD